MKTLIMKWLIPLSLFASTTQASAIDLGYNAEQLDGVWQALGSPKPSIYEGILGIYELSRPVAIDTANGTVTGSQCRPPRQCVAGQKPNASTVNQPATQAVEFDVVRVSNPENLQTIYRRLGIVALYTAKNLKFNGALLSEDDKARLDNVQQQNLAKQRSTAVRQQMASANVEAYLLSLSQYYLAEELESKCTAMRRGDTIYKTALAKLDPTGDLLPDWLTLYQKFSGLISATQKNADRFIACTVTIATARAQMVETIKSTVDGEVTFALSKKVTDTLKILNSASIVDSCFEGATLKLKDGLSEFQKIACLKSGVDHVAFDLEETFKLSRDVKNARANLDFIKEAEPGVRTRQDSMLKEAALNDDYQPIPGAKPFPKLSEAKNVVAEVASLADSNKVIVARLQDSLTSAVQLAAKLGDVTSCAKADNLLKAVIKDSSAAQQSAFIESAGTCLNDLNVSLGKRIKPTVDDKLQEKLANDVHSLSSALQMMFLESSTTIIDHISNAR